jgi:hypothetical protein
VAHVREEAALGVVGGFGGVARLLEGGSGLAALGDIAKAPDASGAFVANAMRLGISLEDAAIRKSRTSRLMVF